MEYPFKIPKAFHDPEGHLHMGRLVKALRRSERLDDRKETSRLRKLKSRIDRVRQAETDSALEFLIREIKPEDHERIIEVGLAAWAAPYKEERDFLGEERFALINPDWREQQTRYIRWGLQNAETFRRAKRSGHKYVTVNVGVDPYDSAKRAYEKAGFVPLTLPTVQ